MQTYIRGLEMLRDPDAWGNILKQVVEIDNGFDARLAFKNAD